MVFYRINNVLFVFRNDLILLSLPISLRFFFFFQFLNQTILLIHRQIKIFNSVRIGNVFLHVFQGFCRMTLLMKSSSIFFQQSINFIRHRFQNFDFLSLVLFLKKLVVKVAVYEWVVFLLHKIQNKPPILIPAQIPLFTILHGVFVDVRVYLFHGVPYQRLTI